MERMSEDDEDDAWAGATCANWAQVGVGDCCYAPPSWDMRMFHCELNLDSKVRTLLSIAIKPGKLFCVPRRAAREPQSWKASAQNDLHWWGMPAV
eukprot:4952606-Amphidinium_carterae.1